MRKILEQRENIYHHLGIYAVIKKTHLKSLFFFTQTPNEIKNKLEQLEHWITI